MAAPHPERDAAIDQLCAITATDTPMGRRSIEQVLRSTEWNVEQAANLIFSNPDTLRRQEPAPPSPPFRDRTTTSTAPPSSLRRSKDRQRDSAGGGRPPPPPPPPAPVGARVGIAPLRALMWPVRFILRLISGLWYLLVRNVLPLGLLPYMPRFLLPPSGSSAGYPSIGLSSRLPFVDALRQECPDGYLPDFWRQPGGGDEDAPPRGTYKEFLDHLKAERKVGCVVLCCSDHEDDLEFKRNVLTNEEFVKCLRENDILIWGADVREREGYQVSQTLQATTYPAISFFSLMPVTASAASSGSTTHSKFTILTTVQGPPSTTTSAPSLIQLITTTIVPRTRPFLNRLGRERHALEQARRVREEQDRALAATERRDRDKILAIRRANEARAQAEREAAVREAVAREREQREREQRERDVADMREWRRYARQHLLPAAGAEDVKAKRAIRVQIRLPHGGNAASASAVRAFPVDMDTAREVYIWAETLLLGPEGGAENGAEEGEARLPAGFSATEYPPRRGQQQQQQQQHLELFTAYPRKHVSLDAAGWRTVVDAGGSLVMEPAAGDRGGDDSEGEGEGEGEEEG